MITWPVNLDTCLAFYCPKEAFVQVVFMLKQKISAHRKIHNAGYSREALTCFFCLPLLIDFPIECLWLPRWLFDEKWMKKVIEGCKLLSGMQRSIPKKLAVTARPGCVAVVGDAILFFIETRNCFIIDSYEAQAYNKEKSYVVDLLPLWALNEKCCNLLMSSMHFLL